MIELTYSDGSTRKFPETGDYTRITVPVPAGTGKVVIRTGISLVDVHEVWSSTLAGGPEKRNLPWVYDVDSGAQKNVPFVAAFNTAGVNRGCFGTTDLQDDTRIRFAMNQETGRYDITCTVSLSPETKPFDVILDCREIDWQEALADWRRALALPEYRYPAAAYDPVYCTWYAVHGAVTREFVEETCPAAKELGFTTLIVDDGWCYDDMKRVCPETIDNWYERIGDWDVSEKKFPAFKEHVRKIQNLGMKYMVWVAPHLWGVKSELYRNHPGMTVGQVMEGYDRMDVHKADFAPLIGKLRKLAAENRLDGLKIDFLDIVPPDAEKPNGRATETLIAELTGGLKADNPDALIEFRQSYAIPGMLKYGTQFRAGDVPFNWMSNFGRLVNIRLTIGSLGPVHADPAYWPFGEKAENVARHMMAMLVGVPMISMDLTRLTETEKRIIRFYTEMYNARREVIHHGEWRFTFGWSDIEAAIAENASERLVIVGGEAPEVCFQTGGKPTYVCNLSARPIPVRCENAVDCECRPAGGDCIPPAGSGLIR